MKRIAVLCVLLACSCVPLTAQTDVAPSPPRFSVTAFTGVRAPYGMETVSVYLPTGGYEVGQERSGGALLGADARLWLRGRVSLVGGGAFTPIGETRYFVSDSSVTRGPDWIWHESGAMWFARLGLSARFESPRSVTDPRPRPSTDLIAGAAVVREFGAYHPALNVGFAGSVPIHPGLDFSLGLENYLVFWDTDRIAPTVAGIVQRFQAEKVEEVVLRYGTSNVLQLRAGFSLHR